MEQFDLLCVMSSENQQHTSYSVITNNSTTSSSIAANSLHLEDAIAVIRDIAAAEGQSGLLPGEQAFVPAELMASEEDNDNISVNDFTTTTYSSQVAAIDTSCSYPAVQDYLTKPPTIELEPTQPGSSQQFLSATSAAPYWGGDLPASLDTHQNRYFTSYPTSPQSNFIPYSSPYYGRATSVSPSLIAGVSPSSPSYKFQRAVISPYGINARLNAKNYIFSYPKISRKSRKHFMFTACEYSHIKKVYIWDLNGVLVPHIDQIEVNISSENDEAVTPGKVRQLVQKALRVITENSFFYKDLEAAGLTTIDDHSLDDTGQDLSSYDFSADGFTTAGGLTRKKSDMSTKEWNRKIAFRCRRIKDIYTRQSTNLTDLLQSLDGDGQWSSLTNDIDIATDQWPAKAINCLSLINSRTDSCSIVISKEPLITMIAKTVVFGLAPYTPITSHYSTAKLGMEKCLKQVTDRYGTGCTFIILSNNPERIELAVKNNNYASWPLSSVSDLCSLQTMLQLGHL